MPPSDGELWCLWTFGSRLSTGQIAHRSWDEQVEAYDEIDALAAVTACDTLRRRCLDILTSRPDVALMARLLGDVLPENERIAANDRQIFVMLNACAGGSAGTGAAAPSRWRSRPESIQAYVDRCRGRNLQIVHFDCHGATDLA